MRRPEQLIQTAIKRKLESRGWYVKVLTSTMYCAGMPDIFACHRIYGIRLIEVKLPEMEGSKFTKAQLDVFPKLNANGAKVWILTGATNHDMDKLFKPANLLEYLLK
jgi:hypothetical protein